MNRSSPYGDASPKHTSPSCVIRSMMSLSFAATSAPKDFSAASREYGFELVCPHTGRVNKRATNANVLTFTWTPTHLLPSPSPGRPDSCRASSFCPPIRRSSRAGCRAVYQGVADIGTAYVLCNRNSGRPLAGAFGEGEPFEARIPRPLLRAVVRFRQHVTSEIHSLTIDHNYAHQI